MTNGQASLMFCVVGMFCQVELSVALPLAPEQLWEYEYCTGSTPALIEPTQSRFEPHPAGQLVSL
jgi:hypothetical protein